MTTENTQTNLPVFITLILVKAPCKSNQKIKERLVDIVFIILLED
jgi:hypothetical protein